MKKSIKKLLRSALLILSASALIAGGTPHADAYINPITTIRVGLNYASNGSAVYTANLVNYVGYGFYFGYYDSSRNFVQYSNYSARYVSSLTITAYDNTVEVKNADTSAVLYQQDTSVSGPLAIMPIPGIGEKCVTWCQNVKYYGGFEFTALSGGKLQIVNVLDIEDYLKGVVPMEMMPYWPAEALKAQAMCARNFVATHMYTHGSFDVCDTTCCQAYEGLSRANASTDAAVDATAGKYVLYNGQICQTYYHSSNGGATESCINIWTKDLPYLVGRIDEYDTTVYTGFDSWSFTYTAEEITDILNSKGYSIGKVTSVTPVYTAMGNIYSLTFSDGTNSRTFSKASAGSILDSSTYGKYTYSQRFKITSSSGSPTGLYINSGSNPLSSVDAAYAIGGTGDVSKVIAGGGSINVLTGSGMKTVNASGSGVVQAGTSFVVTGSGWGHNVGMSQYGAKAMASAGKTYEEIIKYYFSGVTIG